MRRPSRLVVATATGSLCTVLALVVPGFGQARVTGSTEARQPSTVPGTGLQGVAAAGTTKVNPKDGLTYVWIPAGLFRMGCSPGDNECVANEEPAHEVTLTRGFWIGQTEVTQEAYQRVKGSNPSSVKGARLPVGRVIWDEAKAYCESAGMRLPTEAEWEYAARGGNPAARYGSLDAVAWHGGNSGRTSHDVAQKAANAFGLYDVLGNVWEWVSDWYDEKYYQSSPRSDPLGPMAGSLRLLRGASWTNNAFRSNRVSFRNWYPAETLRDAFGVRCAGASL